MYLFNFVSVFCYLISHTVVKCIQHKVIPIESSENSQNVLVIWTDDELVTWKMIYFERIWSVKSFWIFGLQFILVKYSMCMFRVSDLFSLKVFLAVAIFFCSFNWVIEENISSQNEVNIFENAKKFKCSLSLRRNYMLLNYFLSFFCKHVIVNVHENTN